MNKLSDLRSLSIFRSLVGSTSTAMKAANPKLSTSYRSFANLKTTAEKLMEEASVKTDLEMADTKWRRATEQINLLEGKLQQAVNENVKLKVKQNEESKLWEGLDSKISSTKTLWQLKKTLAENHKQELLEKILKLESDNQELQDQVQSVLEEKCNNSKSLQGEITKRDHQVDTLGNQINQLCSVLNEKEQHYSCTVERERTLEDQKLQVEASLAVIEYQLSEAKKQYDLILEAKQIQLSKHLKELSLKNDQVINEICKKYEIEKAELTTSEKEKAEKQMEIESECNEKISSESYLVRLKEEHGTMVERILQDNEHKESMLWSYHKEELQRIQSQAENEVRKEKQRALLQVMGQVDQEVNSKKENLTSLMKMRDPIYGRKEHGLSTNCVRSLHRRAAKDSDKKEKDPPSQRYPGNTATVVLDRDNPEASLCSYKRAIRKARAWCRFTSKPVDLSAHFGPGAEVFTTPADGTFHLTFQYNKCRLTLFIYGRDLYVKGWHSEKNGTFQMVKDFIPDPRCKFVDTGDNYHDLCRGGKVSEVRVGLEALIESFEVFDKCDGVVTTDLARKLAMFCVGTSESIRLQDVFEGNIDSFITSFPYLCEDASDWIRRYGYYSKQYLQYLHKILSGDPPPKIANRPGVNVTSIQELRQRIRVPLRDSYDLGDFEHEEAKTPVWSPPYADGEDWDDKQLDEDDEKYWPSDDEIEQDDEELKNCESEEVKQNNNADDVRAQKVDMNIVKDQMPVSRSSIFRFTPAIASSNVDFLGTYGFYGAINMVRMNTTSHCQPFLTAPGRMKVSEVKSSFAGHLQSFSAWRKLQFFTKFLNKFK